MSDFKSTARILVIDDNPVNREYASRLLGGMGFLVDVISRGQEAEKITRQPYALVLTDLQMPEQDGYATARWIRTFPPPFQKIPIIAVTAYGGVGLYERCRSVGINDFVNKPLTVEKVNKIVERWWYPGTQKRLAMKARKVVKRIRPQFGF